MGSANERTGTPAAKAAAVVALAGLALGACGFAGPDRPAVAPVAAALDARDRAVEAQAFQHALENNRLGESANWSNPETGRLGTVTPTRTYEARSGAARSGAPCRSYRRTVTAAGKTAVSHGAACRRADGVWRVAAAPARGYPRTYYYPRYAYAYPNYAYPYYGYRHYYGYYPRYRYRYRYGLFYPNVAFGHFGGRHFRYGFGYWH